jgi:hypothetical protein
MLSGSCLLLFFPFLVNVLHRQRGHDSMVAGAGENIAEVDMLNGN